VIIYGFLFCVLFDRVNGNIKYAINFFTMPYLLLFILTLSNYTDAAAMAKKADVGNCTEKHYSCTANRYDSCYSIKLAGETGVADHCYCKSNDAYVLSSDVDTFEPCPTHTYVDDLKHWYSSTDRQITTIFWIVIVFFVIYLFRCLYSLWNNDTFAGYRRLILPKKSVRKF